MCHMRLDKVTGGEGAAKRQFSGKNRSTDYAGQTGRVLSGSRRMRASHAEYV